MTYKQIFIGGITILGMYMLLGLMLNFPCKSEVPPVNSPVIITEECERNPKVKSSKNAIGPFQITKIYVDEVNNLYNTNFVLEDAWDLDKALTMFEMMNDHYNPTRDIDRAIKLHNPGAGKWYGKRIKDRMELIRFSEALRFKIVELYDN